jgi:ketopantoate reductase
VGPHTTVVPVQNGVDAADHLQQVVDRARVLGGTSL